MTEHTRGPWTVSCIRTRIGREPMLTVVRPDGAGVALVPYSDIRPGDHAASYADARLIAAAPELLTALAMLHECSPCQNGCAPDDMTCASNVATAAITKAREATP